MVTIDTILAKDPIFESSASQKYEDRYNNHVFTVNTNMTIEY